MSTYRGKFENGKVVFEGLVPPLREGDSVVIVTDESKPQTKGLSPDDPAYHIWRKAVKTGIKDLADEHDHYAYGSPKRGKPEKPSDV